MSEPKFQVGDIVQVGNNPENIGRIVVDEDQPVKSMFPPGGFWVEFSSALPRQYCDPHSLKLVQRADGGGCPGPIKTP